MKISFYEYLISTNVVSAETFINAFIHQAIDNPTLADIIRQNKLLNTDDFIRVFEHQQITKTSFEQSCKVLNLWTPEFSDKLESIVSKQVPSIFKYLIKDGSLTFSDLTNMLDEYIAMILENPHEFGLKVA